MKEEKRLIIITSVMTLVPTIVGLIMWKDLPQKMPSHWNSNGEVDGFTNKAMFIFLGNFYLLILHLIISFATMFDKKIESLNKKVVRFALWIVPTIAIMATAVIYPIALGTDLHASDLMLCFIGVIYTIIGIYLSKVKFRSAIGIRTPSTMRSLMNWIATHNMAEPVWMTAGMIIVFAGCLPINGSIKLLIFVISSLLAVVIPIVYSELKDI
jgi:uncharacterized membrane protein